MSLRRLARLYGIQTAYCDLRRRRKEASAESLLAALQALGAPLGDLRDVPEALRQRRRLLWQSLVEPVVVAWDGKTQPIELRLPAHRCTGRARFRLDLENGTERQASFALGSHPATRAELVEGDRYVVKRVALSWRIPWGYHRLTVETPAGEAAAALISAPREAYAPPQPSWGGLWGVFAPLYALHTPRSWGTGDFSDLEALMEWTARRGGAVVATLPFLAAFLDEPFEPSPYSPASRLFWNELYVDPTRAPEWESCPKARRRAETPAFRRQLRSLRSSRSVDYRRVVARKREVLEMLAEHVFRSPSDRRSTLERFVATRPLLRDYGRFRATAERLGRPWTSWPTRLQQGRLQPGDYRRKDYRYHVVAQWLAHEQLESLTQETRRRGVSLYLDLPLGVHPLGFDVWRDQELFVRSASVGAPPDPVFTGGQDWGFPPLHPERSRQQAHRYFRASIRHQLASAGILRIDHVMGLHRMFWIPKGLDFRDGVYVRYPSEELYAVLSLESHRSRSLIVGENLGIVPGYVNRDMARHRIRQMYLMQYALRSDRARPLKPIPTGSVASLNTHDTPLFAAFWRGTDIDDRVDLGLLSRRAARRETKERSSRRRALVSYLAKRGWLQQRRGSLRSILAACLLRLRRSRAAVVLVSLEDLWLETRPQNTPGSGKRRANWRRKLRYGLEQWEGPPGLMETLTRVFKPHSGASLSPGRVPAHRRRR